MKAKLIKVNNIYTLMDGDKMVASSDSDFQTDYEVMKLSKENCDEIFGVVDVEKLAKKYLDSRYDNEDIAHPELYEEYNSFIVGFNKRAELNKDKVFTLEDIRKAIAYGESVRDMDEGKIPYKTFVEFIQSLHQPAEIEVMVEMEWLPIATFCTACGSGGEHMKTPCDHKNDCSHWSPKLDSNGFLILKRVI
jgi:hypothetical protein